MSLGQVEIKSTLLEGEQEGKGEQFKTSTKVDLKSAKITSIKIDEDGDLTLIVEDEHEFQMTLSIPAESIACQFCKKPGLKKCNVKFDGEYLCEGKVHCVRCSLDEYQHGPTCFDLSKRE